MNYKETPEFKSDFKKLKKRYTSLPDDFETMKKNLLEPHFEQGIQPPKEALIDIKGSCRNNFRAIKIRKFSCDSLKNKGAHSGIRVILVLQKAEMTVTFLEIYYKGDKENENKNRLNDFVKNLR
jgi:hypothetical protein